MLTQEEFEQKYVDQIVCGDCLQILKQLPDKSVDLVFASPPYEDARFYNIDFRLKGQAWVDWSKERFIECVRVCRGLVAWVVEGRTRQFQWSATPALLMADLHRAGVKLRKPPAFWRVGIPGSGGPDWWRNDYEFIVCASHGKLPWSDNTACGHPPKYAPGGEMSYRVSDGTRRNQWGGSPKSTGGERKQNGGLRSAEPRPSHIITSKAELREGGMRRANGKRRLHGYTLPGKANPGNVIKAAVGGGVMGDSICHENEAPFPEALAERFILSFCPPGGLVLDPFSGSGTTAKMAVVHHRHFIAIDIRESEVELTRRRVALAQPLLEGLA